MKNSFFSPFSPKSREILLAASRVESHPGGVRLFEENAPPDSVYLVLSGEVEIVKKADPEEEAVLATVGPGGYFGEMGVLDDQGRSASARTRGPAELMVIPAEVFLRTLKLEPSSASLYFLRRIDDHLRLTSARFVAEILRKEKLHAVGEMAASIIHDLRNPMAGIRLHAELVQMLCESNEEVIDSCRAIMRQIDYMGAMVGDIIDYTRGEARIEPKRISVNELFGEVELLTGELIRKSGVECIFRPLEAEIRVDKNSFIRVFLNLLSNAADVLVEGGGRIAVEAVRKDDSTIELRVTDNGPGIPEEVRQTFFDPFVTSGKRRGIGLGMAVVRSIVEAHGGSITFETESGEGTRFIISLPLAGKE